MALINQLYSLRKSLMELKRVDAKTSEIASKISSIRKELNASVKPKEEIPLPVPTAPRFERLQNFATLFLCASQLIFASNLHDVLISMVCFGGAFHNGTGDLINALVMGGLSAALVMYIALKFPKVWLSAIFALLALFETANGLIWGFGRATARYIGANFPMQGLALPLVLGLGALVVAFAVIGSAIMYKLDVRHTKQARTEDAQLFAEAKRKNEEIRAFNERVSEMNNERIRTYEQRKVVAQEKIDKLSREYNELKTKRSQLEQSVASARSWFPTSLLSWQTDRQINETVNIVNVFIDDLENHRASTMEGLMRVVERRVDRKNDQLHAEILGSQMAWDSQLAARRVERAIRGK